MVSAGGFNNVSGRRILVIVSLLASVTSGGCLSRPSSEPPVAVDESRVGSVTMAVRLPELVNVERLQYRIWGNGIAALSGTIGVGDESFAASASAQVGGIPPGVGYRIEMDGLSVDRLTSCAGTGTFDVRPGQASSIEVLVRCRTVASDASAVVPITACGNGVIEGDEECDPPAAAACGPTCRQIAVCGNGIREGTELCDPPDGLTCNSTCQLI